MAIILKLNGKPFDLCHPRPTEVKIRAFLDQAPADEIFTNSDLAIKIEGSQLNMKACGKEYAESLPTYTARVGGARYWGNPKAIAELLRRVKNESN
jgi:hypothetical protein